jgi:HlyD family secretion protein
MEVTIMNKTLITRITGITAAALVGLTFTSRTIYGMNLPVVYTVEPRFDTVPLTAKTTGILDSEAALNVIAGGDWRVSEVFVSNGNTVEKGDLLFTIDTRELEIQKKSRELEILRLENAIEALNSSPNMPGASSVSAPFDGKLLDVQPVFNAQRLPQGQVLGRFVDDSAFVIPFHFSVAYRNSLRTGMSIPVSLPEWMTVVTGTVESISDSDYIVSGARTVLVRVRIPNAGVMTAGAYAAAEFVEGGEVIIAAEPSALRYAREEFIAAPMSGMVTQTNLSEGARFNRGATLLRMSPEAVQSDSRAAQRSFAELTAQLELSRMQLEQHDYPFDGNVYAEVSGTVFNMTVKTGGRTLFGEQLLSILPESAPLIVRFSLGAREGADFGLDLPVAVAFYALQPDPKEQRRNSTVRSYRLSDDGSRWEYTCIIEDYSGTPLMDIGVDITIGHSGEMYMSVVPISAVTEGPNGPRIFIIRNRNGLFGEEFYVSEMNVTILASNPYVAALDQHIWNEIVTYASSSIMDGDVVRVEGR